MDLDFGRDVDDSSLRELKTSFDIEKLLERIKFIDHRTRKEVTL